MKQDAARGRLRFMERFEWPSVWETEAVQSHLLEMWEELPDALDEELPDGIGERPAGSVEGDHDAAKARATVGQYSALVGEQVADNLEGIARARLQKPPRAYQTDAEIHADFTTQVVGGGGEDEAAAACTEDNLPVPGGSAHDAMFQPMGTWDDAELRDIINFKTRTRLNASTKELLDLPCMRVRGCLCVSPSVGARGFDAWPVCVCVCVCL